MFGGLAPLRQISMVSARFLPGGNTVRRLHSGNVLNTLNGIAMPMPAAMQPSISVIRVELEGAL